MSGEAAARAEPQVHVFKDTGLAARAVAGRFVELAARSIRARGRFAVALAGGATPRRAYESLASDEFRDAVDWPRVHVFFGDERCVPPDHPESNYRTANEALLARVPVPAQNVRRMRGEGDPEVSARLYEDELRGFFAGEAWPRFDLVMLGLGDDGHTASLFPHTPALAERTAWVAANRVEKLGARRLTLTAPALNQAAHVVFMVAGAGKSAPLAEVLCGARDPSRLPAQMIEPLDGTLEWFVDKAAAAKLQGR